MKPDGAEGLVGDGGAAEGEVEVREGGAAEGEDFGGGVGEGAAEGLCGGGGLVVGGNWGRGLRRDVGLWIMGKEGSSVGFERRECVGACLSGREEGWLTRSRSFNPFAAFAR